MKLFPALAYSHELLTKVIQPGDTVVDATVGNGHDTEFLAELVGSGGLVIGFDIQQPAIDATTARLVEKQISNVELHLTGHENVDQYLHTELSAAIFNLGYLPGGDKNVITTSDTTLESVRKMMTRLKTDGVICLVIYYGHPGGEEERRQVEAFAAQINQAKFNVLEYQFINQANTPPKLVVIQKR